MNDIKDTPSQTYLVDEMALPRKIDTTRVFEWLSKGWADVKELKRVSTFYAALFLMLGLLISFGFYVMELPYLILPALSGFLLVGPAIAVGFYEGSLRCQRGEPFALTHALLGFQRNTYSIMAIGIAQVFLFMVWIRLSFTLFAIAFPGVMPEAEPIMERMFSQEGIDFALMIVGLGAVFASIIFFTGSFSLPMMIDRKTVLIPAMLTSAYAVVINFKAMVLWAGLIVLIMFLGLITGVGLILAFPLIGHATWHAYCDVIGQKR
ncbi:putative integral membrane protein [Candidatus Terasakiella magnetica]|uniref:Putative integral membrane protein n=1 Tax=Candidatus Terasakiella magnetica TaxID=1867952 RepID=A0A1C3RGI8_9PROT|nr:DUF2189 domain-containing protein [Candidatus Terasakiella magnetica]SCA56381.1 putative integral membrane protein [Candidatus Terasakiella magnetica]